MKANFGQSLQAWVASQDYARSGVDDCSLRLPQWLLLLVTALLSLGWLAWQGPMGGVPLFKTLGANFPQALWQAITSFGDIRVLLIFALPFCRRHPRLLWAIFLAVLCGWLMERGLKALVQQPRPAAVALGALVGERQHPFSGNYSFPSGHTVTVFAFLGVWLSVWPFRQTLMLLLLGILVAYSRVMLGLHWPLDVLVGATVGTLSGMLGAALACRWHWGERPRGHYLLLALSLTAMLTLPFVGGSYPVTLPLRIALPILGLLAAGVSYGWPLLKNPFRPSVGP